MSCPRKIVLTWSALSILTCLELQGPELSPYSAIYVMPSMVAKHSICASVGALWPLKGILKS